MKVVLVATGYTSAMEPLVQHKPTPLLKIADKPILYFVIESFVKHGFHHFDIILNHLPHSIEESIQEGKRWGATFTFHLARNGEAPFDCLRPVVQEWEDEKLWVGQADILPILEKSFFSHAQETPSTLCYFPNQQWSGWGVMPASALTGLPPHTKLEDLPGLMTVPAKSATVQPFLSTRTFRDLVRSNYQLISSASQEHLLPSTAYEVEKGIWISHAVSLHRGVKIEPPVFIGENCQIKDHVQLGPQAIIENNCIVNSGSVVHHSLICQKATWARSSISMAALSTAICSSI